MWLWSLTHVTCKAPWLNGPRKQCQPTELGFETNEITISEITISCLTYHVSICADQLKAPIGPDFQRWATATFFLVRNHNSATCRKHLRKRNSATFKEMLLRNSNSVIAIFSEVRNLRASLLAYFWPWCSLKLDLFYHQVFFLLLKGFYIERILKGQKHEIFGHCFFFHESTPYEPLSHSLKDFWIRFLIAIPQI